MTLRNNILTTLLCFSFSAAAPQSSAGFEQMYYMRVGENPSMAPRAHLTSKNNWYGEARYNYDELQTFSLYGGRTFAKKGDWSYSATPLIGGLVGKMNGGSFGLNMDLGFENVFFSTVSQYTFSLENRDNQFFYSWSELGYQAVPWLFGGMALQQTNVLRSAGKMEPGCMLGLSIKNWTVPFYVFNPAGKEMNFVVGFNWEWEKSKSQPK
ncbi:MAG: hypothetical protein ABI415_11235 [Flavitalea sp.]